MTVPSQNLNKTNLIGKLQRYRPDEKDSLLVAIQKIRNLLLEITEEKESELKKISSFLKPLRDFVMPSKDGRFRPTKPEEDPTEENVFILTGELDHILKTKSLKELSDETQEIKTPECFINDKSEILAWDLYHKYFVQPFVGDINKNIDQMIAELSEG